MTQNCYGNSLQSNGISIWNFYGYFQRNAKEFIKNYSSITAKNFQVISKSLYGIFMEFVCNFKWISIKFLWKFPWNLYRISITFTRNFCVIYNESLCHFNKLSIEFLWKPYETSTEFPKNLRDCCAISNQFLLNFYENVHGISIELEMTWWRHQMETFSALPAICVWNSPITGEFPAQRPVPRSFEILFDLPE